MFTQGNLSRCNPYTSYSSTVSTRFFKWLFGFKFIFCNSRHSADNKCIRCPRTHITTKRCNGSDTTHHSPITLFNGTEAKGKTGVLFEHHLCVYSTYDIASLGQLRAVDIIQSLTSFY